ncbi:hypothetical protein HMPREF9372_2092 [Sporosarcina newyorkensis 2681]|uniref:Uncharacterized protein n=1 Tax=Sporosarcina newyorkensis 2681 TaxID=1027292 RepID=F9DTG1_9BACL|nr:hypothetical protein [Sporosarcina newyorkensis]EGQ25719.1 hypothetical protein HMPREF9372_2092 [Sporosarcina newyorkensis 2681]
MNLNKNFIKVGAAALLSVGILSACGDDEPDVNDNDVNVDEPVVVPKDGDGNVDEPVVVPEDNPDTDVDMEPDADIDTDVDVKDEEDGDDKATN